MKWIRHYAFRILWEFRKRDWITARRFEQGCVLLDLWATRSRRHA